MSDEEKVFCDKCGKYFTQKRFESHYKKCVPKFCLYCGKQLLNKDHRSEFCDAACYIRYSNIDKELIKNKIRICKNCGKEFQSPDRRKIFCSSSCSATFNNTGMKRSEINTYKNKDKTNAAQNTEVNKSGKICLSCGKELRASSKKFCSLPCQYEFRHNDYIQKWLSGEISGTTKVRCSLTIKNYLLDKYENKCQKCGWSEQNPVKGNIPLEIHHIDGNWENNRPENLELLCPNCHSLTETFRGYNTGNGVKKRQNVLDPKYRRNAK
jgi:hypothetical protein